MVYRCAMVLPHNEPWARPQKSIHIGYQSCEKSSILLNQCCNFLRTVGERLYWTKVPMVVAWEPRCVCVHVCVCMCVSIWQMRMYLRSVFYTNCSLPYSFLMIGHFWPGTPRMYKSWIKYSKLYANKYCLFCVLKSSLLTKSWTLRSVWSN